jgi:hypothetical protein
LSLLNDSLGLNVACVCQSAQEEKEWFLEFWFLITAPDWFWELKTPSAKGFWRKLVGRGVSGSVKEKNMSQIH